MRLGFPSLPLLLLSLVLACRPVEDRWTATALACADSPGADALDAGCAAALDEDFAIEVSSFDGADLAVIHAGLFTLLVREAGDLETLEDAAVHGPLARRLRRAARQSDVDDLGAAAYNLASAQVSAMRSAHFAERDWRAAYDPQTGDILIRTPIDDAPESVALLLFHEAMHGVAPAHVACPDDPDDACDRSWSGSYGLQADYADLLLARCDWALEPEACEILSSGRRHGEARVLASAHETW